MADNNTVWGGTQDLRHIIISLDFDKYSFDKKQYAKF